jgi:hypothetical protein
MQESVFSQSGTIIVLKYRIILSETDPENIDRMKKGVSNDMQL